MLITRAAILFMDGETVEGHSYSQIIGMANKLGFKGEHFNGFITSAGEFVWPTEAADIALVAGQIKAPVDELTPEDIFPEYVGE